ncbi:MAG: alginate export family protein [Deltaproteobacteria bacterium]|nr:alginate export family protein [Deltaproteobacteria bacterium]
MKRILTLVVAVAMLAVFTIPASAETKVSGEWRLRAEETHNTNYSDDKTNATTNNVDDDTAFWGQRVRLAVDATPTDDVAARIVLQGNWTWGQGGENANGGPNLSPFTAVGLHEASATIKNFFGTPVAVKLGRQELNYGDQRLIGSFGWSNNGRSFDAAKATFAGEGFSVDAFTAKLVDSNAAAAGDLGDDRNLYGIYATLTSVPNNTIDVYLLQVKDTQRTNIALGAGAGATAFPTILNYGDTVNNIGNPNPATISVTNQELFTYGFRVAGAASGLDYGLEIPFQTGTVEGFWLEAGTKQKWTIDHEAMAIAAKVGFTLPGENKIRIGLEYDWASGGNKDKGNGKMTSNTFANLYPTNHDKYGYMDLMAWRNMSGINLNVSGNLNEKLNARLDYWMFELDTVPTTTVYDGWYTAGNWNGAPTGCTPKAGKTKCSSDIGSEIDITVNYKYNAAVSMMTGVSRFMPGAYITDGLAAPQKGEDRDWMYFQILAKF